MNWNFFANLKAIRFLLNLKAYIFFSSSLKMHIIHNCSLNCFCGSDLRLKWLMTESLYMLFVSLSTGCFYCVTFCAFSLLLSQAYSHFARFSSGFSHLPVQLMELGLFVTTCLHICISSSKFYDRCPLSHELFQNRTPASPSTGVCNQGYVSQKAIYVMGIHSVH